MFRLLRIHQYIKNIFIFAPLFFSFHFKLELMLDTVLVFILFSLLASAIYIFNDFMDIEEDKKHPIKKDRPLANGKVSKAKAITLMFILSIFSLSISFYLSQMLFIVLIIYFILNIAYSLKLKHITIVDIFIIATGFVLRLFAGASVLEASLSMWIIILTFLLALFLAIAKRRDDVLLSIEGKSIRKNIDGYNLEFVNALMVVMSSVIIVCYILYTVSSEVIIRLHSEYLYLTAFFVILGITRYMQITFVEKNSGSPTTIVLNDKFLQTTILLWLMSFFIMVKI